MSNLDDFEKDSLPLADIQSEKQDEDYTPLEYKMTIYPADYTLEVLHQKWKNDEIEIPKFQRGYVWTIKQASRLIESYMMGLPIPPVFFYIQPANQKNLVIDGRQRLETAFFFFEGVFRPNSDKPRVFTLEGINPLSRWFGKSFKDFDPADKRKLKNTVLRSILVQQVTPSEDDTSIYHIFERLNTGGTTLQDQEVRNCIYAGRFNDLLLDLNKYPGWRKIIGKANQDPRQKDVQLVLRCIALYHEIEKYRKPMIDFLSKFMSAHRNPPATFLKEEQLRFENACDSLLSNLGERPTNPKGALNSAVLDAIFVAFMRNLGKNPLDIRSRFERLMQSEDFQRSTQYATTDTDTVHSRLAIAEEILFQ